MKPTPHGLDLGPSNPPLSYIPRTLVVSSITTQISATVKVGAYSSSPRD